MDKCNDVKSLKIAANEIRKKLVRLCFMQNIHIGGDLSITDVMTVLWRYQMNYNVNNPLDEKRDRFVLSKGHAAAVTAFCQASIGCFDEENVFSEYATDGGRFSMHSCNLNNKYVEVSTGSLGHGMPVACGIAAALRLKGNMTSRVYTVLGDGEHGEGSIWEALANAKRYNLGNLVAIVDNNGLEADGYLSEITGLGDLAEKYRQFGWDVRVLNGNCIEDIKKHFDELPAPDNNTPIALICNTTKGKGVSFMENECRWHAGKISEEEYIECLKQLEMLE